MRRPREKERMRVSPSLAQRNTLAITQMSKERSFKTLLKKRRRLSERSVTGSSKRDRKILKGEITFIVSCVKLLSRPSEISLMRSNP